MEKIIIGLFDKCTGRFTKSDTFFFAVHIIKSFSFYKSTVYKKSAMSLNVKPDNRRMSAQKNASAFGLGFSFRGQGPIVIY